MSCKGVSLLATIWQQVVTMHPDVVLLLVGTGGVDMHACEDDLFALPRE